MNKAIILISIFLLVSCGSAPTKKQGASGPVALSSMMLSRATSESRYGVLLGVYFNKAEANQMVNRTLTALNSVDVPNPVVITIPVTDAKKSRVLAVVAGQYPQLKNAHYLQRITTTLIPGQYNLVTVPRSAWLKTNLN